MMNRQVQYVIQEGHVLDVLADMPEESCHCVVTSPPYWSLRDYGESTKALWPGYLDDNCHWYDAWHGQLGLEPTIDAYVEHIVEVFRVVRRVLRKDGTLWINCGDSYNAGRDGGHAGGRKGSGFQVVDARYPDRSGPNVLGLKPKDLIGQPWRIAFALQADGWILRSAIIWAKPNAMPESVTDRPTHSYEHVFLFAKSPRYFYDAEAVRENCEGNTHSRGMTRDNELVGHNLRDIWSIPTERIADAHFATFPRRLAECCIKAGTSERGCCPECGLPWVRVVETERVRTRPGVNTKTSGRESLEIGNRDPGRHVAVRKTLGWKSGCNCFAGTLPSRLPPIPCTVLDPFCGSGQCGIVVTQLGRAFVGIEINPDYAAMARRRIANPTPLPATVDVPGQMELAL